MPDTFEIYLTISSDSFWIMDIVMLLGDSSSGGRLITRRLAVQIPAPTIGCSCCVLGQDSNLYKLSEFTMQFPRIIVLCVHLSISI